VLHRISVFAAAPVTTLPSLLLQFLLCFCIRKTKEELDAITFGEDTMEFLDDLFSDFTRFEPAASQPWHIVDEFINVPSKAHFLAHTRRHATTNLGGDGMIRQKMLRQVLVQVSQRKSVR